MFAWFISFNKDISRIAVLGTPSDSLESNKALTNFEKVFKNTS